MNPATTVHFGMPEAPAAKAPSMRHVHEQVGKNWWVIRYVGERVSAYLVRFGFVRLDSGKVLMRRPQYDTCTARGAVRFRNGTMAKEACRVLDEYAARLVASEPAPPAFSTAAPDWSNAR